jgi:hypothetical protein
MPIEGEAADPQPTTVTSRWALAVEALEQAWQLMQAHPIVPGVTAWEAERNCREQIAEMNARRKEIQRVD